MHGIECNLIQRVIHLNSFDFVASASAKGAIVKIGEAEKKKIFKDKKGYSKEKLLDILKRKDSRDIPGYDIEKLEKLLSGSDKGKNVFDKLFK